jgi:TM2 domain-containing membrane protein YozV
MSTIPNQPESPQPESAPASYCQNCGRALSAAEVRTVGGMIYCEPCLAQRLGIPHAGAVPPTPGAPGVPYPPVRNSPVLAGLLGFIPGVGAMYNGQVAKGLVHVVIFIALISAADHFGPFGILIAAWIFYQVFDAYQTAYALGRGLPLPDPLGLNQIAAKFGFPHQQAPHTAPPPVYPASPYDPMPPVPPMPPEPPFAYPPPGAYQSPAPYPSQPYVPPSGFVPPAGFPQTAYVPPPSPPADFGPGMPGSTGIPDEHARQSLPTGAFVLVGLGIFFLLATAGVFSTRWLHHGWPVILIALGIFIFFRNSKRTPGGPQ